MAGELGRKDDAAHFHAEYRRVRDWANHKLWDEKTRFYYPVVRATGKQLMVRSNAAFWLLWAGIPNKDQKDALVAAMFDPKQFFTTIPLPGVALNDPTFNPKCGHWGDGYCWPLDCFRLSTGCCVTESGSAPLSWPLSIIMASSALSKRPTSPMSITIIRADRRDAVKWPPPAVCRWCSSVISATTKAAKPRPSGVGLLPSRCSSRGWSGTRFSVPRRPASPPASSPLKKWDRHLTAIVFCGFSICQFGASPLFQRTAERRVAGPIDEPGPAADNAYLPFFARRPAGLPLTGCSL